MPARKREREKEQNRPTSATNGQKSGTDRSSSAKSATSRSRKRTAELESQSTAELPGTDAKHDSGEQGGGKPPKKRSPSLRVAARKVKQAIPDIVDRMVEEAKKGNVQHLKTVLHCTGVDKLLEQECQPKKQKSLAEMLIRRLETANESQESAASRTESE